MKKLSKLYAKAGAFATTGFMALEANVAFAQGGTISEISGNMEEQAGSIPILISWVAYLSGAGMAMAGIFKLRQHVDSPQQVPMKDGLIRLVAGGGLLGLPVIITAMTDFASGGGNGGTNLQLPSLGPASGG